MLQHTMQDRSYDSREPEPPSIEAGPAHVAARRPRLQLQDSAVLAARWLENAHEVYIA